MAGRCRKACPSEAVTISSPERRMYAHFLGRDRFARSESLAPRDRICGRRERIWDPGKPSRRKIRDQIQDVW
jgi:ferredoxin